MLGRHRRPGPWGLDPEVLGRSVGRGQQVEVEPDTL